MKILCTACVMYNNNARGVEDEDLSLLCWCSRPTGSPYLSQPPHACKEPLKANNSSDILLSSCCELFVEAATLFYFSECFSNSSSCSNFHKSLFNKKGDQNIWLRTTKNTAGPVTTKRTSSQWLTKVRNIYFSQFLTKEIFIQIKPNKNECDIIECQNWSFIWRWNLLPELKCCALLLWHGN